MENTMDPIEAAQEIGTFDVLDFINNIAYPQQTTVIYTDAQGAQNYIKLVEERFKLEALRPKRVETTKKIAELSENIEAIGDRISRSAIIFKLMGLSPHEVEEIIKPASETEDDESDVTQAKENVLMARSIVSISNHAGVTDTKAITADTIAAFRKRLKQGEFSKLVRDIADVNFNAVLFDRATDAGFSGRGSDLA
jgi:hypothetical protein